MIGFKGYLMKNNIVKFVGVDSFNRPVFIDKYKNYYGNADKLFRYSATKEEIKQEIENTDLRYFGGKFDCEPMNTPCKVKIDWN